MMLRLVAAAAVVLTFSTAATAQQIDRRTAARIDRILKRTPLIDGHNDLPWQLRDKYGSSVEGLESGSRERPKPMMTDIARLRAGRVGGQFWSVFVPVTITGDAAIRATLEQIDVVRRMVERYPRDLELATTAAGIRKAHRAGRIASLMGVEGAHQLGGSLAALRMFHALGVRYMTLTHSAASDWADSATAPPVHNGLSALGRAGIGEMNRLGMLVDLSHVSEKAMLDALAVAQAPVIFSHSSAFAVTPHPRNVSDTVLRRLADNGGVAMVTFYPSYVDEQLHQWVSLRAGEEARLKSLHPGEPDRVTRELDSWTKAHPRPAAGIADVADHIEHVAKVAGHDHVGIGGDFDGMPFAVTGLEGVEGYPLLLAELVRRGWSDANLARLAGGNLLRVLYSAEAAAERLARQPPLLAAPVAP